MKKIATLVVAAALIAPATASAQRITTPGTFERHAQNLEPDQQAGAQERAEDRTRMADNESDTRQDRVPAAKAGKVNVSTGVTS